MLEFLYSQLSPVINEARRLCNIKLRSSEKEDEEYLSAKLLHLLQEEPYPHPQPDRRNRRHVLRTATPWKIGEGEGGLIWDFYFLFPLPILFMFLAGLNVIQYMVRRGVQDQQVRRYSDGGYWNLALDILLFIIIYIFSSITRRPLIEWWWLFTFAASEDSYTGNRGRRGNIESLFNVSKQSWRYLATIDQHNNCASNISNIGMK